MVNLKVSQMMSTMFEGITRIKSIDTEPTSGNLKRCLGVLDLTMMGVGGMVGTGVYVLAGIGARDIAGPGIILSFTLAAVITFLITACFTEFATQIKLTGSTYQYMYVTTGEMSAFIMGFFRLLTALAGGAINGRACSAYLDYLTDNTISGWVKNHLPSFGDHMMLTEYPDFIAGVIIMLLVLVCSAGVQFSSKFNMVFAFINIAVLLFAGSVGFSQADWSNWTSNSTGGPGIGDGGFLPYGWSGVLEGTGVCFWAFIGWDIIVLSAEETKKPAKTIPIAMAICISLVTLLYVGVSSALTLMTPYSTIDSIAPLPSAFDAVGISWAKYIVAFGPLCGLTTALLTCIFVFIRMTYAMAEDGLIFGFFGKVNQCTNVPVLSCVFCGFVMSIIAILVDIRSIISFSVLITLFQLLIVNASVIILRYKSDGGLFEPLTGEDKELPQTNGCAEKTNLTATTDGDDDTVKTSLQGNSQAVFELEKKVDSGGDLKPGVRKALEALNCTTTSCVPLCVFLILVISFLGVVLFVYDHREIMHYPPQWSVIVLLGLFVSLVIILLLVITAHQQTSRHIPVKVPLLPLTPYLSMIACLLLMVTTADLTRWIGFGIVTTFGLCFYLVYGAFHSKLGKEEFPPLLTK